MYPNDGAAVGVVGSRANAGHEPRSAQVYGTLPSRLVCRDITEPLDEQHVLAHIMHHFATTSLVSPSTVAEFYVSLKTNPFVILTGAAGQGKTEFVEHFAEALFGPHSPQFALLPSAPHWTNSTGEHGYYQSINDRFCSWRFLELLQEAAQPTNASKAYLVCFDALQPEEAEHYFGSLLEVLPDGTKRLNLPGTPPDQRPVVPPNVSITATIDNEHWTGGISERVLRHAGLIRFYAPTTLHAKGNGTVPPVGYQRIWLRGAVRSLHEARRRLYHILGDDALARLRPSAAARMLLWQHGIPLSERNLDAVTMYVANSFDAAGCGLFDPHDRFRNAQLAYDLQVLQRSSWQLGNQPLSNLYQDAHIRRTYVSPLNQAVA